jgi:CDP-4-dehydro-6-deoxyglucose reductase
MAPPALTVRLVETRELCPEVRHFVFEVTDAPRFDWVPGQFVSFSADVRGKRMTRAYSIASPPRDSNRFELCLNRVREGIFSPYLFDLQLGDTVAMKGPLGGFVLRQQTGEIVMVATGTGIAPIRSILATHVPLGCDDPVTLIFGARYEYGLHYREEFDALARERANFHFWPTITRPEDSWKGRRGRVQSHLLEVIGERRELDVYICGLKEMVDDVRAILKGLGFERRRIIYEKYD